MFSQQPSGQQNRKNQDADPFNDEKRERQSETMHVSTPVSLTEFSRVRSDKLVLEHASGNTENFASAS